MSTTTSTVIRELTIGSRRYHYFSLAAAQLAGRGEFARLPFSLKVLAENLLRHEASGAVAAEEVDALGRWCASPQAGGDLNYHPARVIMPEIGGLPLLVDLCGMRDACAEIGADPARINPQIPVDLVVDHSVVVDVAGSNDALQQNMTNELERNVERYQFLKWAQQAFRNLTLIPPGNGILHQINLERLASVVAQEPRTDGLNVLYSDCLIGMDSHTPMINAIGVMGWGVGGVEAGAAMLGQPVSLRLPEVVGCRLIGQLQAHVTATDLVLTVAQKLRAHGVVQKFVEFCGNGLDTLPVTDRATLSNMAPEYGATMGFMPVDLQTLAYLRETARTAEHLEIVEAYTRTQGLFRETQAPEPVFSSVVEIDLSAVEPSMSGPFRPTERNALSDVASRYAGAAVERGWHQRKHVPSVSSGLHDGIVGLAAITSCTNTSNPAVLLGAGLLAKAARERGLISKPWVKTSLAPGSRVVADYLLQAGLQNYLDELGFHVVGFGCTTCMGNSGNLHDEVSDAVDSNDLNVVAVLSGNRNFEGRVHPQCRAAFLGSPLLVVAYAIAGTINIDLANDPIAMDVDGRDVYLRDLWPTRTQIDEIAESVLSPDLFAACYAAGSTFETGDDAWQALSQTGGDRFTWNSASDYLVRPPYFQDFSAATSMPSDLTGARALLLLGDMVTTDHISPVNVVPPGSVAGEYLQSVGVEVKDFSSYAARRANHEVMVRGTFSSPRLVNELCPDSTGGSTRHIPSNQVGSVYAVAHRYRAENTPLVVIAGAEYGTGSSRDWAAKGTMLLGVRAVVAQSIERIHRSNLVGLGVLPVQFPDGVTGETLGLNGGEKYDLDISTALQHPGAELVLSIQFDDGRQTNQTVLSRLDTQLEVDYFCNAGMLPYVLRRLLN